MKLYAFKRGMPCVWLPPKILSVIFSVLGRLSEAEKRKWIMRINITAFLIFMAFLSASATGFAQITLSEKNTPLEKVLDKIRVQSGFDFVGNLQLIRQGKPVSVKLNNVSVEDALKVCFAGQPISFVIDEKTILITKEEQKSVIDRVRDYFASINVKGRVVDENGQGLGGVTVAIKNGNAVTTTSALGGFYLKNIDSKAILTFSYIGYNKKEISIEERENIGTVQMLVSTSKLDEIQIIFGGTTSRRISTSGVTTITKDDIKNQPIDNPLLALQGRVPGLIVAPASGAPGAAMQVQLRGQNSLFGQTTEPLYVVNGVPMSNNIYGLGGYNGGGNKNLSALSFLNSDDIESIDVLKDADATAIYGSRGANGVILITTKKGKIGAAKVNVNVSSSFSEASTRVDLMNTQQYLQLRREAFKNDGIDFSVAPFNTEEYRYANAPDLFLWNQNKNEDWQDKLLGGTAKNTSVQAGVTGGSEFVQYTMGGNYNHQGYILPGKAKDENASGYINLTGHSLNQKLVLNLSSNFAYNRNVSPSVLAIINLAPNAPDPYTGTGELNWAPNPKTGQATWINPFKSIEFPTSANVFSMNQNATISYDILSGLSLKGLIGFNQVKGESFTPIPLSTFDPSTWSTTARRSSVFAHSTSSSFVAEPQLFYKKNILSGILDIMVGGSYQSKNEGQESINAYGFASDGLLQNLISATGIFGFNNSTEYKYVGLYSRISYNWKEKYLLNLNGRRDGSSKFGPENRYGNFGSVAGAWVFSNEKWLQKLSSILSYGKLRASYGVTGNDAIQDYQYIESYENVGGIFSQVEYQGLSTIKSTGVTNPYFKWETVKKLEFGLDLGFMKDRLLLSTAYYRNRCDNQIASFYAPSTVGVGTASLLINRPWEIQNSGLEISISSTNFKTKDFDWMSSINLSIPRNKLLNVVDDRLLNGNAIGEPFSGVLRGYNTVGVDPETGLYQFATQSGGITLGANGDAYPYASTTDFSPRFFGGFQNTLRYKKLTLSVFAQFSKQGGTSINFSTIPGSLGFVPGSFNNNQPVDLINYWQEPGDKSEYSKPTLGLGSPTLQADLYAAKSQLSIVDASYIRLKNASISYQLIDQGKSSKIKSLSVDLRGQNLFTITKYKGYDPEIQNSTLMPQLRTLSIGLRLGL